MSINIENLSVKDLLELNKKIISRVKELKAQEQLKAAERFRMGEVVSFQSRDSGKITGIIMSMRKTKISILTEDNEKWTVSPALLTPEKTPSKKLLKFLGELFPPSLGFRVGMKP